MSRIAIIGGHGQIALHLSRILTSEGHEVTALFRNPDHATDVKQTGAKPVVADVEHLTTDTICSHLKDHDAVVWSAGAGGGNAARTYAVDRDAAIRSMDAAKQAGVGRYVMVSYHGARLDHGVAEDNAFFAYAEAKAAADDYLKKTRLDWTILGPSRLTTDPATGKITVGDGGKSEVTREDVALVAAAALDLPGTVGKFIEFNNGDTPIREALQHLAD
ncbi:putative NADH-flavin reductase [Antricoccus suffuscus]|uniref:Putative NADH-flavin reductase n=1 Tax=Antricoccus suffuscus TaxID=1629062 RepID=A0A2T0ZW00_9ACTN|nr:NAD(P)H-binding protein [Antricoccus suffuscus]PRZ40503.1 putative NADH-flavin reductase [Antricoccus suffuscus]